MKQSYIKIYIIILIISTIAGCRLSRNAVTTPGEDAGQVNNSEGNPAGEVTDYYQPVTWLLGYFDPRMMKQSPHEKWYTGGFDRYMPQSEMINKLLDLTEDDLTIKIVMGSWCPDSRREVPRFMKILDIIGFPQEKITFVGVDLDKRSPVGGFDDLRIERVPTFIFYKKNVEAGRIIEVPVSSLEQDMVKILSGND